ncbi:hypothetical protein [Bradyrhizobium sp. SRS-191]|uniref:hypothetical protein n=1 Tax=Bradyrhizobium sp. SRS-191 TaxID=2962606 RepID=UPI00211F3BD5|nr:hypothetical protein [Bradyrhizobium sp. SRS-191]
MSVQSTPKEVDPGDVALTPENEICEQIYQRVLTEVRARIDQRIAAIEAEAAADDDVEVEAETVGVAVAPNELVNAAATPPAAKRRPLLRATITLAASAGLVGAVVTLARDHQETITSVTDRIEAAIQSLRREAPQMAMPAGGRDPAAGSSAADTAETSPASSPPPASSSPEPSTVRSSDPSSAMAEAPERDMPPAPDRDIAPLIEKIAHDVAALQTGLQDLKTSQEQSSRDQAKAIEQLQASQDQLARAVRAAKTEPPTTVGAAARLPPRPPQTPARPPRFPNF